MTTIEFLTQPEVKEFIRENINSDATRLILNPPSDFKEHIKDIAGQIQSRQKAKGKLDQWAENFDLIMPPPLSIEQASSQTTGEYKQKLIAGELLVDLTGGMGIDCLVLSGSFKKTIYVERNSELCEFFQHNSSALKKSIKVVNAEASDYLKLHDLNPMETTVFIDPARRDQNKNRVFHIEDCSPNLLELMPILRQKASKVLVKYSPLLDITSIFNKIKGIKELHVVSVKNDCKELLLLIDFEFEGTPIIKCVNLKNDQLPFIYQRDEEQSAKVVYGDAQKYIYEPNSSILKAGAFNKISEEFKLIKLGANTHLYTSEKVIGSFPGRIYEVIESANKQSIKKYASDGTMNVVTRNYPMGAQELKKKWKIRDGGNYFLLAFRDTNEKATMLITVRTDL